MDPDTALDRLKRRLDRQTAGLLMPLADQAAVSAWRALSRLMQSLRAAAEEKPIVTVLIALETGFTIGLWRARHAKH
jgi:hypothetical protein